PGPAPDVQRPFGQPVLGRHPLPQPAGAVLGPQADEAEDHPPPEARPRRLGLPDHAEAVPGHPRRHRAVEMTGLVGWHAHGFAWACGLCSMPTQSRGHATQHNSEARRLITVAGPPGWIELRWLELNQRPPGYEPGEIPLLHTAQVFYT